MMAAAMTTRNSRAPTYADLARASAVVKRELAPAACSRLAEVVTELGMVSTELRFSLDAHQRVHVAGLAQATVGLACQLCTEPVTRVLQVELEGVLAASESQAEQWRVEHESDNVIVVTSDELDAAELVEDELLLQLPSRVCIDTTCERRPLLSYGPSDQPLAVETHKPFAALAELKKDKHMENK
jgi:uncharacterized metal-binding protein YceD (DUF177 family)